MRSRWLLSGTVALTTSLALVASLPGSARAVGEPATVAAIKVADARAKALAEDMARTDAVAKAQAARAKAAKAHAAKAKAAKAKVEEETTSVRIATFNVRTARADRGTSRHWLKRAGSVAREIKSRNPGVVLLQELGPGRADGKKAKLGGATRQTESLLKALKSNGAGKYKLVRTTAYVRSGTEHGTQGARILYDSTRYTLLTSCRETTGGSNYNPNCGIKLPILSSDSEDHRRRAAYALFQHRSTGQRFSVASVHLDDRHGGSSAERKYDRLRVSQMSTVYNKLASLNGSKG
jgi:endonuclease/exonuclease/phosphatase family metal-dependent hydrolase